MKESQFDTQNSRLESNTTVSERDERPDGKACTEIENAASECETAETDKMYGPFDTVADLMNYGESCEICQCRYCFYFVMECAIISIRI